MIKLIQIIAISAILPLTVSCAYETEVSEVGTASPVRGVGSDGPASLQGTEVLCALTKEELKAAQLEITRKFGFGELKSVAIDQVVAMVGPRVALAGEPGACKTQLMKNGATDLAAVVTGGVGAIFWVTVGGGSAVLYNEFIDKPFFQYCRSGVLDEIRGMLNHPSVKPTDSDCDAFNISDSTIERLVIRNTRQRDSCSPNKAKIASVKWELNTCGITF